MLQCSNCGTQVQDGAQTCPQCGSGVLIDPQQQQQYQDPNANYQQGQQPYQQQYQQANGVDEPDTLANVASCCFPIVGIIGYFIWKDTKPKRAKAVCKWAAIGWGTMMALYVLWFIGIFFMGMLGF